MKIFSDRNESLHEIGNIKKVRVINFVASRSLISKSTMFPHHKTHKCTWTSPDGKKHNKVFHVLLYKRWHSSRIDI
jgi:hypothetical protein